MKALTTLLPLSAVLILFLGNCNDKPRKAPEEDIRTIKERIQVIENKEDKRVDVWIDGKLFTSYIHPASIKKPVLYPVNTSSGVVITRGYPLDPEPWERVDHPHHVGIWLNHGDVNDLDFWNNSDSIPLDQKMHYGTIYHRSVKDTKSGDDQGYLEIRAEWERPDGRVLLDENSEFYFTGREQVRIIDRITTLTARDLDVIFKDSKEGVLAIRVIRELEQPVHETLELLNENLVPVQVIPEDDNRSKGHYVSSEGLEGDAVWGSRARWVKLAADYQGQPIGIVIMDHPENPNHPTHWHARGYGLFAANPFGSKMFTDGRESLNFFLPKGNSVVLKYRIYIYDGTIPDEAEINQIYDAFISTYESGEEDSR
jgi:hypothetical protein